MKNTYKKTQKKLKLKKMNKIHYQSVAFPQDPLPYDEWKKELKVSSLYYASSIIERIKLDEALDFASEHNEPRFPQEQSTGSNLFGRLFKKIFTGRG